MTEVEDDLFNKLQTLNERLWEHRARRVEIEEWLGNFTDNPADSSDERLHALFLLSQFVFFGQRQVRELLRALFRDHFRYPIVASFRRDHEDTTDLALIQSHFDDELRRTRFLGLGSPAESGTHLLYYFRQINGLSRNQFVTEAQLVDRRIDNPNTQLAETAVSRLVFIDDFCGSGTQAIEYSDKMIGLLRDIGKRSNTTLEINYLVLMAAKAGLDTVRAHKSFDRVEAVFELDDSYKCLEQGARQFSSPPSGVNQPFARAMSEHYGAKIVPAHPLGFEDGQLLLGFHHNVPDNTLPILWCDTDPAWTPLFPRFQKLTGSV